MSLFGDFGNKARKNVVENLGLKLQYFLELRVNGERLQNHDEAYYAGIKNRAIKILDDKCVFVDQWVCGAGVEFEDIAHLLAKYEDITAHLKVVLVENDLDVEKDIEEGRFVLVSESFFNKGHIMQTTSFSPMNEYEKKFNVACKREKLRLEIEDKVKDLLYLTQAKEKEINALQDKLNALTT